MGIYPPIFLKNVDEMKYKFELFERHDSGWNGKMVPTLVIGEHPAYGEFFNAEINNLRLSYLRDKIVPSLEMVIAGRLERYNFGFEIYDFVCDRNTCKVIDMSEDD